MPLKVKLDESLPASVGEPLSLAGYELLTVVGQGWGGLPDSALWPLVQAECAFLVTTDKEFANIRRYPPGTHAGVLLLRPARESISDHRRLLTQVLAKFSLQTLVSATVVAEPAEIRIRKPPELGKD